MFLHGHNDCASPCSLQIWIRKKKIPRAWTRSRYFHCRMDTPYGVVHFHSTFSRRVHVFVTSSYHVGGMHGRLSRQLSRFGPYVIVLNGREGSTLRPEPHAQSALTISSKELIVTSWYTLGFFLLGSTNSTSRTGSGIRLKGARHSFTIIRPAPLRRS